jgi:hypothetical protein
MQDVCIGFGTKPGQQNNQTYHEKLKNEYHEKINHHLDHPRNPGRSAAVYACV